VVAEVFFKPGFTRHVVPVADIVCLINQARATVAYIFLAANVVMYTTGLGVGLMNGRDASQVLLLVHQNRCCCSTCMSIPCSVFAGQ
jgi:hypothetical protein